LREERKEDAMNKALASTTIAVLLCTAVSVASAQQAFKTTDEAAAALVRAAKTSDMKALRSVLGPDGEDIVSYVFTPEPVRSFCAYSFCASTYASDD
jgi:hypothetical protein